MSETTDAQIEEAHRVATWLRMRSDAEMARFQAAEPSDDRVLKAMVLGEATALRDAAEAIESGQHYADLRAAGKLGDLA